MYNGDVRLVDYKTGKLIEKNKRRETYENWDSKSFLVWWSDYLFKFIPRTILFFGLIGLVFYGIGNWLN